MAPCLLFGKTVVRRGRAGIASSWCQLVKKVRSQLALNSALGFEGPLPPASRQTSSHHFYIRWVPLNLQQIIPLLAAAYSCFRSCGMLGAYEITVALKTMNPLIFVYWKIRLGKSKLLNSDTWDHTTELISYCCSSTWIHSMSLFPQSKPSLGLQGKVENSLG